MARTAFIAGIWVLAASLGVLGYQVLTLYFYRDWPAVSLGYAWQAFADLWHDVFGGLFQLPQTTEPGSLGARSLAWLAGQPLTLAGILLAYALFLLSDTLRGRNSRARN